MRGTVAEIKNSNCEKTEEFKKRKYIKRSVINHLQT